MAVTLEVAAEEEGSTAAVVLSTVVAIAVAASTGAGLPMAAIAAACPVAPDAPEASAENPPPAAPDPQGPGLGKVEALATPRQGGIRLPDRIMEDRPMEDQPTAEARRQLTAQAWMPRAAAHRLRTAPPSPTDSGTASETPAVRLHPRRTPGSQHSTAVA